MGWDEGRNVRIDTRWGASMPITFRTPCRRIGRARAGRYLGRCRLGRYGGATGHPHRADRVCQRLDPVGAGFVASLARPGGNTTGFTLPEYSISGKWLELLKEIAPGVTRVAVLRDPGLSLGDRPVGGNPGYRTVVQCGVEPCRRARRAEIERAVAAFARSANGGLIVTAERGCQSFIAS